MVMLLETQREEILELISCEFEITRGRALPLGASVERGGVNFALFSQHATAVTLVIFRPGSEDPIIEFLLDPLRNRTGNIWHIFVGGIDPGIEYGYRLDRAKSAQTHLDRFDPSVVLLDPYAHGTSPAASGHTGTARRSVIVDSAFDWETDQPLDTNLADSVIYEVHVGAFTRDAKSGVASPGTFTALVEKIPYLQSLGITAVELMPIVLFDEFDTPRTNPCTGERLVNHWGYHPLSLFSPHIGYSSTGSAQDALRELKQTVKSFHAAGIEVILDAVFNHTGEGLTADTWSSFRGIDNRVYYMLDAETGQDRNFSGCGNTLNCNHPVVRDLILDCLRYWVVEVHVDGFRFDLASILGRGPDGSVLPNPPLIEQIAADPVLARTKLIAEAWDASGLYQVGSFTAGRRWAEWNGKFRDDVRSYLRGDSGMAPAVATRIAGSSDLYQANGRSPYHSINFVTCHDGFTLADLVAYNEKHNQENGEDNRDGCNHNLSWNCGMEGPAATTEVEQLRQRQVRNFATLLLLSHGVPMLLYGDEVGRSQLGNNNAYCQDQLSRFDWGLVKENHSLLTFFQNLIEFRKRHRCLRRNSFIPGHGAPAIRLEWHGTKPGCPDWSYDSHSLAVHLYEVESEAISDSVYLISNAYWESQTFQLPRIAGLVWKLFIDTHDQTHAGASRPGQEKLLAEQSCYAVGARSTVVLVGESER